MTGPLALLTGRLQDTVLGARTLRLAPGVEHHPGRLTDRHLGVDVPLNATADTALHLLTDGDLCVDDAGESLAERWPGQPVRRDLLLLLRRLNSAGLVQPGPPGAETIIVAGPLTRPLSALSAALSRLASGSLFVHRTVADGPGKRLRLALIIALTCLPVALAVGIIAGVAAWATGESVTAVPLLAVALVIVPTVAHELAHAAWLGRDTGLHCLASVGQFRMLVAGGERPHLLPAAASGPLAGAAVSFLGMTAGQAAGSSLITGLAVLVAAGHAFALSPWGSDGRSLRAPVVPA
jgi:hypothetical protein